MKFLGFNKQPRRRIAIPTLAGGINLRDGLTLCNDNQLTEVKNMWYKDGLLRTRPGTVNIGNIGTVAYDEMLYPHQTDIFIDGNRLFYCVLRGSRNSDAVSGTTETFTETLFWLQGENKIEELPKISEKTSFVAQKDGVLYSFLPSRNIYKLDYSNDATTWELVEETEYYVPTVFYHCKNQSVKVLGETGGFVYLSKVTYKATQLEDYNLLSSYYQMVYSTYSEALDTNYMVFNLGSELPNANNGGTVGDTYTIKAEYINISGVKYTHQVTWTVGNSFAWETDAPGGLKMYVDGALNRIVFYSKSADETYSDFATETYRLEDNLTITAPCVIKDAEKNKIFNMTNAMWYGGYATGLASGTRLFLCGNTEPNNKALVCWTGLNNPLYFPEKSCFNVGDTSEAVTAFGKQENTLIIFKEKETWYTVYTKGETLDADDLIDQRVMDLQTSAVYFPLTQIHSNIGCKYPDTVQLCRNRLVWLGGDGKVYTLANQNQYSERNVYCVSDMIENKLKQEEFNDVFSADWNGHYLLFTSNRVYVMDYNSYGYTHIYSYTKTEDAQTKIPWWYWEFETAERAISSVFLNNDLYIVFYPQEPNGYISDGFKIKKLTEDFGFDDDDVPINSIAQTKFFDFGESNSFKNILSIGLTLGFNEGNEINVVLMTDDGSEEQTVFLEEEATERTATFIKSVILSPTICSVLRCGVKFECKGKMIIDGITVDYRLLGRAR